MDSEASLKRRKTLLACEHCRSKKLKCDGAHPVCGRCLRRGWGPDQCIWKHVDGRDEHGEDSTLIQELRERIRQLEDGQSSAGSPSRVNGHAAAAAAEAGAAQNVAEWGGGKMNAVSALEGALTGEPQREGFVGPSSAAAFMSLIRRAVDPSSPSSLQVSPDSRPKPAGSTVSLSTPEALPPREIADELVSLYWEYAHPVNPYLNKARFDRIYRNIWLGQPIINHPHPLMRITEQDSVAMIYLMFALASQYYSDWDDNGHTQAGKFYGEARALLNQGMLHVEDQSLQRVQVMLLMTQYLNGVGKSHKAWAVLGTAIRVCQHLGLHLPQTSSAGNLSNPVDRELVRRVWYGCLINERLMCMILGRLPMVPATCAHAVPLPQEVDEDAFQSDKLSEALLEQYTIEAKREGSTATISFFVLSAQLYDIIQDMLLAFTADDSSNQEALSYDSFFVGPHSVFAIDHRLRKWSAKIPLSLRIDQQQHEQQQQQQQQQCTLTRGSKDQIFRRQAVVLRLRYLQAKIFQFRPVLAKVVTSHRLLHPRGAANAAAQKALINDLSYRTGLQCSLICVKASIELIEVTTNHLTTAEGWGVKPLWLYGVLYVYIAATVLLAARLAPAITLGEIDDLAIDQAWQRALSVLREFQYDNASAQRCVAALEILYRKHAVSREQPSETAGRIEHSKANLAPFQPTEHVARDTALASQSQAELPKEVNSNNNNNNTNTYSNNQWPMDDFDLSNPYDMSWFDVAPDLDPFIDQANFPTASANWWDTH